MKFPFWKKSRNSDKNTSYSECDVDFSIAHAGQGDIAKHEESKKYHGNVEKKIMILVKQASFFYHGAKVNDFNVKWAKSLFSANIQLLLNTIFL